MEDKSYVVGIFYMFFCYDNLLYHSIIAKTYTYNKEINVKLIDVLSLFIGRLDNDPIVAMMENTKMESEKNIKMFRDKKNVIIQTEKGRYQLADFAKGFSILTIVFMHLIQLFIKNVPHVLYIASSLGGTGVHIFILCSGFGLYLSQLKRPQGYMDFLKRRVWKIYVPYILIVIVTFFIKADLYEGNDKWVALLSHIFLFKMFVPQYESSFGTQFWYISTIFQFYFCFILLCRIRNKMSKKGFLMMTLIISILWWFFTAIFGVSSIRIWSSFFLQYLWEFALGMMIAEQFANGDEIAVSKKSLIITMFIGLGLEAAFALKWNVMKLFNDIPALFGYGALIILIYSFRWRFIDKVILWISEISYEWYLVHILVFSLIFQIAPISLLDEIICGIVAIIFSLMIAYAYKLLLIKILDNKECSG